MSRHGVGGAREVTSFALDTTLRLGAQRVRVQVRGEGPPLLLLNGVGSPLEVWQPLVQALHGMQTVAFDAPGSGGSAAPNFPLSIGGHARLALRLLDALGYQQVSVLGFSLGGMVAQELAHRARRRVDRLVLASTSVGWGAVPGSPAALLAISNPQGYYSRALFTIAESGDGDGTQHQDGGSDGREDDTFRTGPRQARRPRSLDSRGHLYQLWAATTWSSLPWLARIPQPTLVLTGDADDLVPAVNSQILANLLPSARLHVVRGGGHLALLQHAAELAPLLTSFLREFPSPTGQDRE
ncbi:MAG: alpha/beta hydrolase [Actinomycetota bacterium]|nr:alpha/beta hydrolase [Actinomycetota bacterium]